MTTIASYAGAPPVTGSFPFIFSDESGVVVNDPSQPFYGIGMLKLSDAGRWSDALNRILDQYVSGVELRASTARNASILAGKPVPPKIQLPRSAYELKFAEIKSTTRPHYEQLIDYFTTQPDGYFCAFIVDKRMPGVNPIAVCGSPWDALITYSITMLKRNVTASEEAIVIADNYQKPKAHPYFFERQVVSALKGRVANAVMMDSASSVLLQLVDVLLGAVIYHYKLPLIATPNAEKRAVADRLAAAYGVRSLARAFTKSAPNYFSVWPYKPKSSAI
jgi:hypothetical protein